MSNNFEKREDLERKARQIRDEEERKLKEIDAFTKARMEELKESMEWEGHFHPNIGPNHWILYLKDKNRSDLKEIKLQVYLDSDNKYFHVNLEAERPTPQGKYSREFLSFQKGSTDDTSERSLVNALQEAAKNYVKKEYK